MLCIYVRVYNYYICTTLNYIPPITYIFTILNIHHTYTGDNIETAKAIARECGILTADGLAMEGPEFRKLTPAQLDDILPRLQVL